MRKILIMMLLVLYMATLIMIAIYADERPENLIYAGLNGLVGIMLIKETMATKSKSNNRGANGIDNK